MKKCLLLLFVSISFTAFSQTDYSKVKMESDADYKPAEKYAMEASNYLLSVPMDIKDAQQRAATQFLIKWIEGTPDFTFVMDSPPMLKLVEENKSFLGLYLAGSTKFALENPTMAEDMNVTMVEGFKNMIAYAEKPENKAAMTATMKKLSEANKNGTLEKEVALK